MGLHHFIAFSWLLEIFHRLLSTVAVEIDKSLVVLVCFVDCWFSLLSATVVEVCAGLTESLKTLYDEMGYTEQNGANILEGTSALAKGPE